MSHTMPWSAVGMFLLIFGFAPRAALRLTLLAYPRNAIRRKELLAELTYIPWWDRPRWVAEQVEIALFEGLRQRISVDQNGRRLIRLVRVVALMANQGDGEVVIGAEGMTDSSWLVEFLKTSFAALDNNVNRKTRKAIRLIMRDLDLGVHEADRNTFVLYRFGQAERGLHRLWHDWKSSLRRILRGRARL